MENGISSCFCFGVFFFIFCFFFFFWPHHKACGNLVLGNQVPAVEAWSINYWFIRMSQHGFNLTSRNILNLLATESSHWVSELHLSPLSYLSFFLSIYRSFLHIGCDKLLSSACSKYVHYLVSNIKV